MSGHNKWSTIKHRKGAQDAKRAKIFTKIIKELTVAARMGGGDPDGNPRLRLAMNAARAANMPKDNMIRAIKKGTGELEGTSYDEVVYEGYGPEGVAMLVEGMTDNLNRTVSEVRAIFNKRGGKMGEPGSVAWMFEQKGLITVKKQPEEGEPVDFEELFMAAVEAGAEDCERGEGEFTVTTAREDLFSVSDALEAAGFSADEAILGYVPSNVVELTEVEPAKTVMTLIEYLEDNDDVQRVWANFDITDEVAAALEAEE